MGRRDEFLGRGVRDVGGRGEGCGWGSGMNWGKGCGGSGCGEWGGGGVWAGLADVVGAL